MTATAQGSTMRCDRAGCTQPATVEKDAWAFCPDHAGTGPATPKPAAVATPPRDMVVRDLGSGATQTLPAAVPQPAASGIGLLLEQASAHSNKRVRALADKIETHLDDLRNRITDLADDEERKKAEAAAKEKAREDIVRLEQQLAAAKAKLRKPATKKATAAKPATDGVTTTSPHPCIDCNGPVTRSAGISGRFPTRCTSCKAAS